MKKIFELLLCILHFIPKLTWGIVSIIPFVPFVYVLTGHDFL